MYAEGTEEFTIEINTVSNQDQFENVTVDKTPVVTTITDETKPYVPNEPDTKDNVNVKLETEFKKIHSLFTKENYEIN